jgi:hypothetical protein
MCLVISSDSDPSMPPIFTYGKSKEEILDKLAVTTETAQSTIHQLRKTPAIPARPSTPAPGTGTVGVPDLAKAVTDLQNPATAQGAIKTLLRSVGVDPDASARDEATRKLTATAQEWHRSNPDFPDDPRNRRTLLDRAILRVGYRNVTAEALTNAYNELYAENMFFEPSGSAVPPRGSEGTRTETGREATSYRRNAIRATPPTPQKESADQKRWRNIFENGNTKQIRELIQTEPEAQKWFDSLMAKTA